MFDSKARLDAQARDGAWDSLGEMVRAYAQEAVKVAGAQHGVRLDFTTASVELLERLLDGQAAVDLDFQSRLWGSYFGEVIRFRWGGEWLLAPYPSSQAAGQSGREPAVPTLEVRGSRLYPTMKVYRRLTMGEGESLPAFYRMVAERLGKVAGGGPQTIHPAEPAP